MWLDSHCHISAEAFDPDRDRVLERAREAGVETLIAIGSGYGVEGSRAAVELADARHDVYATAGVHPHDANRLDDRGRAQLREWLARPRVVAVGDGSAISYLVTEDDEVVIGRANIEALGSLAAVLAQFEAAEFSVPPLVVCGATTALGELAPLEGAHVQ